MDIKLIESIEELCDNFSKNQYALHVKLDMLLSEELITKTTYDNLYDTVNRLRMNWNSLMSYSFEDDLDEWYGEIEKLKNK